MLVYERLAAGNACDGDDEDLYNVDFVRKEAPREGLQQVSHAAFEYDYGGGGGGAQDGGRAGTAADWREPDGAGSTLLLGVLSCTATPCVRQPCHCVKTLSQLLDAIINHFICSGRHAELL